MFRYNEAYFYLTSSQKPTFILRKASVLTYKLTVWCGKMFLAQ